MRNNKILSDGITTGESKAENAWNERIEFYSCCLKHKKIPKIDLDTDCFLQ